MQVRELFERESGPAPWNPNGIDPAMLTFNEYYRIANEEGQFHPDRAYDSDLRGMNSYEGFSDYPEVMRHLVVNGLRFQIRYREHQNVYSGRTPEQAANAGLKPSEVTVAIFNEDKQIVARAQDEWGCVLISVAREYRGFGFGPIIGKIARTLEPGKTSGGFTQAGLQNFRKVHREMVRDALTSGRYREEVTKGTISLKRVKEIVASAKLEMKPAKPTLDFDTSQSRNWLLNGDPEYGGFILYDRKLKDFLDAEHQYKYDSFVEKAVKGLVLVRQPRDTYGVLVQFNALNDALKRFMLFVAASWCAEQGIDFYVDEDDLQYAIASHFDVGTLTAETGMRRAKAVLKVEPLPITAMSAIEARFRKSFDRYGEFEAMLQDYAYGA